MTLDDLVQAVSDETAVDDSIVTLLTSIKAQLDAALKGTLSAADQAKVDDVFAKLTAEKTKLAAAVTANTPT